MDQVRLLLWGTYDLSKPRNRIVRAGLRANGVDVVEIHAPVWQGVEDKSRISGRRAQFGYLARWIASYPGLIRRYLRAPKHDAVVVGYLGQLDVIVLWPFARLRGVPIIFDVLMSLYNAVVEDRALFGPRHPAARLLYAWEWLSARAADAVVVNTEEAAKYWVERFGVDRARMCPILTGAETDAFPPRPLFRPDDGPVRVLFYGTFIPLHGVETVFRAAQECAHEEIDWLIIGEGQESDKARALLAAHPLPRLTWLPWVAYEELAGHIHRADVCLGIFGETRRAGWTIPNKLFQILATGTPVITRDSPGVRDLLKPDEAGVYLIPPGDPGALADAVRRFRRDRPGLAGQALHRDAVRAFEPAAVGRQIATLARRLVAERA